jgi:hypothetical protein
MKRTVTLELPEEVLDEAGVLAALSGFERDELLAKLLQTLVRPVHSSQDHRHMVQRLFCLLPDDEVLQLANLKMSNDRVDLYKQLLAAQKNSGLSQGDHTDLDTLGEHFDRLNLIKSYALIEAVQRKLMKNPLKR